MSYIANLRLQFGYTALIYAVEGGHEAMLQSLVAAGCDTHATDKVSMMFVF